MVATGWHRSPGRRAGNFWDLPANATTPPTKFPMGGVEEVCRSVLIRELEIEIGYFDARRNLQVGNDAASQQQLDGLIAKLPLLPQLIERTWQPVLHYWYGVALSRRSPEDAEEVFRKLCSGPKASPARIQLALLAIKREDLPSAQRWISDASPCFPGALYEQGLLYQRQGKVSEARQTLSLIDARFNGDVSPYPLAAQRLLAALEERTGTLAEAERLHRETLETYSGDAVTASRLGRLLLRRECQGNLLSITRGEPVGKQTAAGGELSRPVVSRVPVSAPRFDVAGRALAGCEVHSVGGRLKRNSASAHAPNRRATVPSDETGHEGPRLAGKLRVCG